MCARFARAFGVEVPLVERASFAAMFASTPAAFLYVVGRNRDEVFDRAGNACFVQEGMLPTKLGEGARHPFVRAIGSEIETLVDGTLGLANDALHVVCATKARVIGIEGSPVMHALLEEGLVRLRRKYAEAERIELRFGMSIDILSAMRASSADVVFLDPMMSKAKKSAPSFNLVRAFAIPDRASSALLTEAKRVASKRVVLKLGKGAPLPSDAPFAFERKELGAHVVYWIHDVTRA